MGSGPGLTCAITLNTALTPEEQRLYQNPRTIQRLLRVFRPQIPAREVEETIVVANLHVAADAARQATGLRERLRPGRRVRRPLVNISDDTIQRRLPIHRLAPADNINPAMQTRVY